MILTTHLKIWTLISHGCILIGLGHGVATLGMLEFYWLSTIFKNKYSSGDGHVSFSMVQLVAFMCLTGQVVTVLSIFMRRSAFNRWMHLSGFCLLWVSVIIYACGIQNDHYAHLIVLSCLPFSYCTIQTLLGGHIRLLWQKISARI
jgi:magnesium-transporting ATPase (P-type)